MTLLQNMSAFDTASVLIAIAAVSGYLNLRVLRLLFVVVLVYLAIQMLGRGLG